MRSIERKTTYWFFIIGLTLLFSICMSALNRISIVNNGLVFFAYICLVILLPGYALLNLLKITPESGVVEGAYILFGGYMISFLEYFLTVPFGKNDKALLVAVVVSLLSIVYIVILWKKGKLVKPEREDYFGAKVVLGFSIILIIFEMFAYSGANILPPIVDQNYFSFDCLVWIQHTLAFTRYFAGISLRYHWFTSAHLANVSLITGIRPIIVTYAFEFIIPIFMMTTGGYLVFAKCTQRKNLVIAGLFTLFFSGGVAYLVVVNYVSHLLMAPNAQDYGMGLFLFIMYLVILEFEKKKTSVKDYIIILILFVLLCGVKANYGAIAVAGIGFVCFKWLFTKDQWKRALMVGLPLLIAFILAYIFVLDMAKFTGGIDNAFTAGPAIYADDEPNVYNFSMGLPFPSAINHVIFVITYIIVCHPLLFPIIIFQIVRNIIRKKRLAEGSIILLGLIAVCLFIRMNIGLFGSSEQYFVMNAYPLCIAFVLMNWDQREKKDAIYNLECFLLAILVIVSCVGWSMEHRGTCDVYNCLRTGFNNFLGKEAELNRYDTRIKRGYVSKCEVEALEWLRNNLTETESYGANNRCRIMECVSERTNKYIPLSEGLDESMEGGVDVEAQRAFVEELKKNEVKYYYLDRGLEGMEDLNFDIEGLTPVFENEESVIYYIES